MTKLKATLRCGIGAALMAALGAGTVSAQSLTDTLILAYRNSNLIEQQRALLRSADEDTAISLGALRPIIDYTLQIQQPDSSGIGELNNNLANLAAITLSQNIYEFGRNQLSTTAARETVLATREALRSIEQDVLLTAIQAFFNVRQASTVVNLQESNLSLIDRELQAARDRFEVGEVTRTDVAVAESRLAQAQSQLAAANGNLLVAREQYRAAVGQYPTGLSAPGAVPRTPGSIEEARSVARRMNPDVLQAQRNVTVAELNAEIAKRDVLPTVSGQAQLGIDDDGREQNSLSLRLDGPIYRGGTLSALYRRSLASRDANRAALLQTALIVDQDVGTAFSNLSVAVTRIQATTEEVRASRLAFEGLREEAALGARTTLEVLDSEQDLLDASTDQAEAVNDRYVEAYTLLQTMGLLTVDGLGLGIAQYDPEAYFNAVKNAPATSTAGQRLDRVLEAIGRP